MLHTYRAALVLLALLVAELGATGYGAHAQPVSIPESYGGDIATRERLTGDWSGFRDQWARQGIVIDADLLNIVQGVASGGRNNEVDANGRADIVFNLDTGKAGLWPGGFLKVHAQGSYGNGVNTDTGGISPVNGIAIFPAAGESVLAVPNFTFTQFLSQTFGVYLGKVGTLEADANMFADDNRTKFLNLGFEVALTGAFVPESSLGAGVIVLPWEGAVLVAGVIDPNGESTSSGLDDPFHDGVLMTAEGRTAVRPFGLLGHHLLGFAWSDKEYASLDQDPANLARSLLQNRFPRLGNPGPVLERILARFFPGLLVPATPPRTEDEAWNLYYNVDQFLWSPAGRPDDGIGIFARFGVSDGNVNPVKYHYSAGIGGKNIVPGRPRDTFGIGWSRLEFSDDFVPFLRNNLGLGLDHEDTFEAYYTFALTDWANLTADIQVIDPGLEKALGSNGRLEDTDTALALGLRALIRF